MHTEYTDRATAPVGEKDETLSDPIREVCISFIARVFY
jgi:hypothetical protein